MKPGDHLYFAGAFHIPSLYHHGVYVGDNVVIHFYGPSHKKHDAVVQAVPLSAFQLLAAAEGQQVHVLPTRSRLPRSETVARATSQLGKHGYNMMLHNCEHFVNWCVQGVAYSPQVDYQFKRRHVDPRATLYLKKGTSGLVYAERL